MSAFERFKKKQGIATTRDAIIIATVFSLAGMSITFTVRPLYNYAFHLLPKIPFLIRIIAYILVAVPTYQCFLLIYGFCFGQFKFFWEREKKFGRSILKILTGVKREPVRIHIRKRIPVGAGLGGGSSDAAATLRGLNRLFGLGLSQQNLFSLAASLGADVPFFIRARPARARGIGDEIESLASIRRFWVVILYPGFPVSTRWVYRHFSFKLTKAIENTSLNFSLGGRAELARMLVNDLERVAFRRYPRIAILKERLIQEGAAGALMSGSGSSVFGIFFAGNIARKAFLRLRKEEGIQAYLVQSLS